MTKLCLVSWIWEGEMFCLSSTKEKLEARINLLESEIIDLSTEKENLVAETSELKDANNQLRQKNDKLFITKEKLTKENAEWLSEKKQSS